MKTPIVLSLLFLTVVHSYSQNILTGYLHPQEDKKGEREIILARVQPGINSDEKSIVAKVKVGKDGFFAFEDSIFTSEDEIYGVQMAYDSSENKLLDTTLREFRSFILSNEDKLEFTNGISRFSGYSTTNEADKEWQKLKKYEEQRAAGVEENPKAYLAETRSYTKDSLQILLVKLLSIKTLDEKKLLDKDIRENAEFYMDLLEKLRESDIEPATYAYLENKIRAVHQDIIERKYQMSLVMNFLGFSGIVGLLFVVFRMQKKSKITPSVPLSRQEENVKDLILQGKSNKEIAAELFISMSTVKTHTSNIYSKLGVANRKDLIQKY